MNDVCSKVLVILPTRFNRVIHVVKILGNAVRGFQLRETNSSLGSTGYRRVELDSRVGHQIGGQRGDLAGVFYGRKGCLEET